MKYAIFAEDVAQEQFVRHIVPKILVHHNVADVLEPDDEFCATHKGICRSTVIKVFPSIVELATTMQIDMVFVGIDYDDDLAENYQIFYKEQQAKLTARQRELTFFFIPVQAIEHWLCYLKFREGNKSLKAHVSLEDKTRDDAKQEIYGGKKFQKRPFEHLLINPDIDFLIRKSNSFKHFSNQIKKKFS